MSQIVDEAVLTGEEKRGFAVIRTDSVSTCSTDISEVSDSNIEVDLCEIIDDMAETIGEMYSRKTPKIVGVMIRK